MSSHSSHTVHYSSGGMMGSHSSHSVQYSGGSDMYGLGGGMTASHSHTVHFSSGSGGGVTDSPSTASSAGTGLYQSGGSSSAGMTSHSSSSSSSGGDEEALQVLQSQYLKVSVLPDGGLAQPFYMSDQHGWTKLTYGAQHLDYAIKVNGHLASISGDVTILSSDEQHFKGRSQLIMDGIPQATLTRSYSFLGDGMVLNITFTFTALTPLYNLQVYLGTSDDWIGTSDRPSKEQGNFRGGSFVHEPHGHVLRVQSGEESVFAFSPQLESHAIILQHYGNWSQVYAATMSDMSQSTSDGAYGIYVPCGDAAFGETKRASFFYAAASASQLSHLTRVSAEAETAGHAAAIVPTATAPATMAPVTMAPVTMAPTMAVTMAPAMASTSVSGPSDGLNVLQNPYLKIAVLNDGSLGQPFYFSQQHGWTKLTYGTFKLNYAIKARANWLFQVNGEKAEIGGLGPQSRLEPEDDPNHWGSKPFCQVNLGEMGSVLKRAIRGEPAIESSTPGQSLSIRSQVTVNGVSKAEERHAEGGSKLQGSRARDVRKQDREHGTELVIWRGSVIRRAFSCADVRPERSPCLRTPKGYCREEITDTTLQIRTKSGRYSFAGDGMILRITYEFTALTELSDLKVWLGTSDDWIGSSDRPTKQQGYFHGGNFVPQAHGKILRVQDSNEEVFVFSPNPGSHSIILQHYGHWPEVYVRSPGLAGGAQQLAPGEGTHGSAVTRSELSKSMSDGAYAICAVPLGALSAGQTKKATIFYAAAGSTHLVQLSRASEAVEVEGVKGGLGQPFYYSDHLVDGGVSWSKLTYGTQSLEYAIKVPKSWLKKSKAEGEAIMESSEGREGMATRSQLSVLGLPKAEVLRSSVKPLTVRSRDRRGTGSYSFVGDGMILKITYSFTALDAVSDLQVWLGSSDDWIGTSDRPSKDQGYFAAGQFVAAPHGKILRVMSGNEGLYLFSPHYDTHSIILQGQHEWSAVSAATGSQLATSQSDGAYAIYVSLGSLAVGQRKTVSIFYAAAAASQLSHLARVCEEVAAAALPTTTTTTTTTTFESTTLATLPTTPATTPPPPPTTLGTVATLPVPTIPATTSTTTLEGLGVLESRYMKIAVMQDGSLGQPFYYSAHWTERLGTMGSSYSPNDAWTKLTYGSNKLEYAIKVDGQLATLGREVSLESSKGTSSMATRCQLSVDGVPKAEVLRSYSFRGNGMVLKITYSFTPLSYISDLQVWLGTSDDWIGTSDRPTKEQGYLKNGDFIPSVHGKILRVQSGAEEVFVFSPHPESHAIILEHYGNWPAVYATTSSDLSRSTSDGAYAIYVPVGAVPAGDTKKATIFYAAAGASDLNLLARASEEAEAEEMPSTTATVATAATTMATLATLPPIATTEASSSTMRGLAVLQTPFLKVAVMEDGSLAQPFYYSTLHGWTKLTYGHKKLDSAIKVDGQLANLEGEAAIESSMGQNSLSTRSQVAVEGIPKAEVLRSYSFLGNGMVLNVTFTFTALSSISSLEVWLGTSDDWIGTTDRPSKQQGYFQGGAFVPAPHGKILQVASGEESVFVFSPDPESHAIILQHYGDWHAVSASTGSDLAQSTSDGAYAIYVPLGDFLPSQKKSATIYYAAAGADHLLDLLRVAESVHGTTPMPLPTVSPMTTTSSTGLRYVLQSNYLKIGVKGNGGLAQPFYQSELTGWTKLTYDEMPLKSTVKIDGVIADMGRSASVRFRDASFCRVREELTSMGIPQAVLERTYRFRRDGLVLEANFTFTALNPLSKVEVWFGTSDDWIGSTDQPAKEQGHFLGTSFQPRTNGQILRVHSGAETLFVFTTHPSSQALIRSQYGRWALIREQTHSELASSRDDGAYGIYVPLGEMAAEQSKSACFYYAAAGNSHLEELLRAASSIGRPQRQPYPEPAAPAPAPAVPENVLQSDYLKFALMSHGGLGQPFYASSGTGASASGATETWTKLTSGRKPLHCTVKVDGVKVNFESDPDAVKWWDRSYAMATSQLRPMDQPAAVLTRSYSFKKDGMVFAANFTFTALRDLEDIQVWLGTSDDWIGTTDRAHKVKGHFKDGSNFHPTEHGQILKVYSG
ncbi:Gliding motility-associated C-terminal domain-containing protein, partial [Durusdinium trenchii]